MKPDSMQPRLTASSSGSKCPARAGCAHMPAAAAAAPLPVCGQTRALARLCKPQVLRFVDHKRLDGMASMPPTGRGKHASLGAERPPGSPLLADLQPATHTRSARQRSVDAAQTGQLACTRTSSETHARCLLTCRQRRTASKAFLCSERQRHAAAHVGGCAAVAGRSRGVAAKE